MTQPWWPDAGAPPAPTGTPGQAPWMPPQAQGQNRQQGQNHPAAAPWVPPTQQTTPPTSVLPAGQPTAVVSTMTGAPGGPTAPAGQPAPRPTVPGLGFVTFVLVAAAIAFVPLVMAEWVVDWGTSIDGCLDAGGAWDCVVNDTSREQVLLPIVAVLAAFSLARGANVERRQGRAIGYLYVLLGFGILGFAWSLGAAA